MLKALLVDDELIIRKGLITLIDWKEYSIDSIFEATNGKEALEILKEQQIDLVITDIRMPIIDGIELMRTINREYPTIKVILLTCYSDFEYAKEALELGAAGYLLKTDMEEKQLEKILLKIKKELEYEKEHMEQYNELQLQVKQSLPLMREKYIMALLNGNELMDLKDQCWNLGIGWLNYRYLMMRINFEKLNAAQNEKVMKMFYQNISDDEGIILSLQDGSLFTFVRMPDEKSHQKLLLWEHQFVNHFFSILKLITSNCNVCYRRSETLWGISKEFARLTDVEEYFTFYHGFGFVLNAEQFIIPRTENIMDSLMWDELKQMIIIRNWSKVKELCETFFRFLAEKKLPVYEVKLSIIKIIELFMDGFHGNTLFATSVWGNNHFEYVDRVKERRIFIELTEWVYHGIDRFEENRLVFVGGDNKVIAKALEYIDRNFYKDITLDELSNYVGLSKSYLSSMFKKVIEESFIDYLIRVRIENAKQLFKQTDLKTSEVAEKVGFHDPKYFAKLFKRAEGIPPKEYKHLTGSN